VFESWVLCFCTTGNFVNQFFLFVHFTLLNKRATITRGLVYWLQKVPNLRMWPMFTDYIVFCKDWLFQESKVVKQHSCSTSTSTTLNTMITRITVVPALTWMLDQHCWYQVTTHKMIGTPRSKVYYIEPLQSVHLQTQIQRWMSVHRPDDWNTNHNCP
jgi:hypothetical protein